MHRKKVGLLAALAFIACLVPATAQDLRVLSSGPDGVTVRLQTTVPSLVQRTTQDGRFSDLDLPHLPRLDGNAALPFIAEALALPPGARIRLQVKAAQYTDIRDIDFIPAPSYDTPDASQMVYPPLTQDNLFWPEQRARTTPLGRLRGTNAHSLHLYPFAYNAAQRILRVYHTIDVEVRFEGGRRAKTSGSPDDPYAELFHQVFLNPGQVVTTANAPAAKPLVDDWYDRDQFWVKIWVQEDGLFQIDPTWLFNRGVDPALINPRTFQLFYLGQEQTLYVEGEGDGHFDEGDRLIFHGRFRRGKRDFESIFGRRNTYWLTWDKEPGRRFVERSGAPQNNYVEAAFFWDTAHFEQDHKFDTLASALDNDRDHWFWGLAAARTPGSIASLPFSGSLPDLDPRANYTARLRASLHGQSDLPHHTQIKLSAVLKRNLETGELIFDPETNAPIVETPVLNDTLWGGRHGAGQAELLIEQAIPASYLQEENRLNFLVLADQEKFDLVFFNWYSIDYHRLHRARAGLLEFGHEAGTGRRIRVENFSQPQIQLFDLNNGIRFTDFQVDTTAAGFTLVFEDQPERPALYVAADTAGLKTPVGLRDTASFWRTTGNQADYLIITHSGLQRAMEPLAEHRRAEGLEVEIVNIDNIYDEFSFGLVTPQAITDFLQYAYDHWQKRPAFVLLAGDSHYDYRNISPFSPRLKFIPSRYYQARGRGHSPSDFLYTLVDGDDLMPDLAIGRLPVQTVAEAERTVEKILRYDQTPTPGEWRSRVIFLANPQQNDFIQPSNELAAQYIEPLGIQSVKIYNEVNAPVPNPDGRAFLDALNNGALMVNYNGHGSANFMENFFALHPDWDYMAQINNIDRLPLVLALSCLNGQFANPTVEGLGELFVREADGGAIAHISATAKSFPSHNNLMSQFIYNQFFSEGNLRFGPVLNTAKIQFRTAHSGPGWEAAPLTMQLLGDPAQKLALPQQADYTPLALETNTTPVFGGSTLKLKAVLRNNTRLTPDSLKVALLAYPQTAEAQPETLLFIDQAPFAGRRTLELDWPLAQRRGAYRLELILDPDDLLREADELNNRLVLDLDILEPLVPTPVFPAPYSLLSLDQLRLEAVPPPGAQVDELRFEFALSTHAEFNQDQTVSAQVVATEGIAAFEPPSLADQQTYFWRVRFNDSRVTGPWSPVRSFQTTSTTDTPRWHQASDQLLAGQIQGLILDNGGLVLNPASLPFRPSSANRERGFTVRSLDVRGAGVLAMDGTYVYVKRWFNDASTIYPGTDFFARVGTGLNGTTLQHFYGFLPDSTTAGISATYHGDGFIYNESAKAFELERIHPESGRMDTVAVPDGLLQWRTGQVEPGHSLITSDGHFIYNVAMSSPKGIRTEWSVRVFDPAANWTVVRQFTSPPTENGFTFQWTDGILADGERLYFIEFGGQRRIRMVDAYDGRLLDEWTSDQDTTRIITGQYDWINNKVWLGDLQGSAIFPYTGLGQIERGQLRSQPLGPAAAWHSINVDASANTGLHIELQALETLSETWSPLEGFSDLAANEPIDLSPLDAARYPLLRLQATLSGSSGQAQLNGWSADFIPLPSLQLDGVETVLDGDRLQVSLGVRNLSAETVSQARLQIHRADLTTALVDIPLAALARGEQRWLVADTLTLPPPGTRLLARLITPLPDADPADNLLEIPLLLPGYTPLALKLWPQGRSLLNGDPLPATPGILVQTVDLKGGHIDLRLNGRSLEPDSLLADGLTDVTLQTLYRPQLENGEHTLEVRLIRDGVEIGFQRLTLHVGTNLSLSQCLPYPHPVQESTAFTYILSADAEVGAEIFSLAGRLVRRLPPQPQTAGFRQLEWDGRDTNGQRLANGTFLYRIVATAPNGQQVEFRAPLSVLR